MSRILYLDEAGTGDPNRDQFVVVAGVLIDADGAWKRLEQRLAEMANRLAPEGTRDGFVFHATEIFSGGKRFPHDKFPPPKRWPILDEVIAVPGEFDLPISVGFSRRAAAFPTVNSDIRSDEHVTACLQSAFMMCLSQIERTMRIVAPNEVAMVIMEASKPRLHAAYTAFQKQLRDPRLHSQMPQLADDLEKHGFPLSHIIENPSFSPKSDSSPLQIADACAFAIKRRLEGSHESERFYAPLVPNMLAQPKHLPIVAASKAPQP